MCHYMHCARQKINSDKNIRIYSSVSDSYIEHSQFLLLITSNRMIFHPTRSSEKMRLFRDKIQMIPSGRHAFVGR